METKVQQIDLQVLITITTWDPPPPNLLQSDLSTVAVFCRCFYAVGIHSYFSINACLIVAASHQHADA